MIKGEIEHRGTAVEGNKRHTGGGSLGKTGEETLPEETALVQGEALGHAY